MDEFLQRAKARLSRNKHLDKVHVVLGKKSCDLDSLISALTYAYYLEKVIPPDNLCLPILNIPRREFCCHTETRFILEELNVPESLCVFRDEIDLNQLNSEGKLSLTLLNSNILTRSILSKVTSMDSVRMTEAQEEVLLRLEEKFPELLPREDVITVLQEARVRAKGLSLEEAMLKDLKEVSDGEIKVAVSTVYLNLEDSLFPKNMTGDLKAFVHKYGFDVLVVLANYLSEEEERKRQIAVYSENMELGNQICCELEECQNPCLELDPLENGCDQLLIYQQENSTTNCNDIFLLMKDFITRRHPEMAANSRTSSTEAVAGSAPLSQGSSGIMELYGSDIEPQANVNFMENPQEHNGSAQVNADVNIDLVSPDSGLATIRSSRSSKESSVFLSDDSPVVEGAASHHGFFSGFDSYSPIPEGAIAEEAPQTRDSSDNFDLFNFDSASVATAQTESSHSVDFSPADDFSHGSGSSEGQQRADPKVADETSQSECDMAGYSTDLSMTRNEVTSDGCCLLQENPRNCEETQSCFIALEDNPPSCPEELKSIDKTTPPTPVNSLVETSPLDHGQPSFYPQDIIKKMDEIDHVNHSRSRARYGSWWNSFDLGSKNADITSSPHSESVFQSPDLLKEYKENLLLRQQTERRASDSMCLQKQTKIPRAGIWEDQFNAAQKEHARENQEKGGEQLENFTDTWTSSQPLPAVSGPWDDTDNTQSKSTSPNPWSKFGCDGSEHPEGTWNIPQVYFDHNSQTDFDTWAVSQCLPEVSKINECGNLNNEAVAENKVQDSLVENHRLCKNGQNEIGGIQQNVKLALKHQNDTVFKSGQLENTNDWDVYDSNIRKEVLGNLVSWEDPFLSYRDPDFMASNTCNDLVVSPPDTNYSTSDSYISPSGTGDERESENNPHKESSFDQVINSRSAEHETYDLTVEKPSPQTSLVCSSDSNYENTTTWNSPSKDENKLETESSELNNLANTILLNSKQKHTIYFSDDYCIDGSSHSSSEDIGVTPLSAQRPSYSHPNNFIHAADGNTEMSNGVVSAVRKSPHLDDSDMESTESVNEQVKEYDQTEQGIQCLEKQWDRQLQHNQNDMLSTSTQRTDEKSGQVPLNNVKNELVQNDNTPLLPLLYVNNSEKSKIISNYPILSEGLRTNGSLKEITVEQSELSMFFPNGTHPIIEDKKKEYPNSAEDKKSWVPFDPADLPKYGLNVASVSVSKYLDMDQSAQKMPEMGSPSSSSSEGDNNQEKCSPGVWNKLEPLDTLLHDEVAVPQLAPVPAEQQEHSPEEMISSLNTCKSEPENSKSISEMFNSHETSLEDTTQEKSVANPHNPYTEYTEFLGTTETTTINNSQSFEIDSSEKNGSLESLDSENKLSNEKCLDIVPHHELSQILDAWSVSLNECPQFLGVSPKKNETHEVSDAAYNFPSDNPVRNISKEDSTYSDSFHDYTYSNATSPDRSYSSTSMHIWDTSQTVNGQKENEDDWNTTSDGQVEDFGNDLVENKTQEDSETSTEHKVPKNLDLWNAPVDDDTVSSLSSPGIDEDSEHSNVPHVEAPLNTCPDKWAEDVSKMKSLQIHETSFVVNSKRADGEHNLKKNVHEVGFSESSEDVNGSNTSGEGYSHETSEYLVHWGTIQDEVPDQIARAINNSDAWDAVLQTESTFDQHQKSIMEDLGFPDDSSEWWNLQKNDDRSVEAQHFNPSNNFKNNDTANPGHDASEAYRERNEKPEDSNLTNAHRCENDFTQYDSEGEGEEEDHPLAEPKKGFIKGAVNCELHDPLSPTHKNERDINQEPLVPAITDQNTLVQLVTEDWQSNLLNALAQVDPKLGLLRDDTDNTNDVTSSSASEINIVNSFESKELDISELSPSHSSLPLKAARASNSIYDENRVPHENSFVPDILQNNNIGYYQGFSVDPDLWNDVEEPLNLRTNMENPDILSHCDQDSSSQASSSPDVCHDHESKPTCAQSSVLAQPEEVTQMSPMLSDAYKDRDFDFNEQLPIDINEIYPEGYCLHLPGNYEASTVELNKLIPPETEEQLELRENILQESDVRNKTVNKQEVLLNICATGLEVVPLNLENNPFEEESFEDQEGLAYLGESMDTVGVSALLTDASECSKFADNDHISARGHSTAHVNKLEATSIPINGETGLQHSINKINVVNNSAVILNDNLPSNIVSEYSTDIMQDHKNLQETCSSCLTGSPNIQLPLAYTSSFDISFGSEDSSQKDDMNISGSNTADAKSEAEEHSEVDQGWGSLLIESDGTPGSSCTLKRFEYDTESSINDSPTQDSGINILDFKAVDIRGEVSECLPEDQGWGSLLLESNVTTESSYVLEGFTHKTGSNNISSTTCEQHLSEDKPSNLSGTSVECSDDSHDWGSLLLESDVTESTDALEKNESEAESVHINSPAGGVTSMDDEAAPENLGNSSKGYKSANGTDTTRGESKECVILKRAEDHSLLEMDYVLITGEENGSLRKDILVTQEGNCTAQKASSVPEQMDPLEIFSADSSDAFQSLSIINENEGQSTLTNEWDAFYLTEKKPAVAAQKLRDEKKSPRSPLQDQEWTMVGQNGVYDISPEEKCRKMGRTESLSRNPVKELEGVLNQEMISGTQAETLLQRSPHKSLKQEDKMLHNNEPDALLFQVADGNSELAVHSQQDPRDGMPTEQEMEEEIRFVDSDRELSLTTGFLPEVVGMDDLVLSSSAAEMRPEPPNSLDLDASHPRRIKLTAPNINLSLDQSEGSVLSDDNLESPDDIDINVDELDTPDEADSFECAEHEEQPVFKEPPQELSDSIPEYTAEEEREDNRLWRTVVIGDQEQRIDMKVIEPYKKVISHGGYYGDGLNAIIVFAACFLPDSSRTDYNYVMENLFLYVISTLELMVAEDYMIVYLNGATPRRKMPGLGWMKRCYQMIDRRLRKNLKSFIIVHPSWFIRTILAVTRPFISSKFSSKILYVSSLAELSELIPVEYVNIPESIVKLDEELREASAKGSCLSNEPETTSVQQDMDMKLKGNS